MSRRFLRRPPSVSISNRHYASFDVITKSSSAGLHDRRVFSGIQPTGSPHLGNYCGAIAKWMALQEAERSFDGDVATSLRSTPSTTTRLYSIVDLHALTVQFDAQKLSDHVHSMVAALLGTGLDPTRNILFRQSDVAAHTEFAWLLSCITPLSWLQRMTQYKQKTAMARTKSSLGLLAYPVLMAADILLYRATHVPVGEDQQQHLELTRMIATTFNKQFKANCLDTKEVLYKPFAYIDDTLTGTGVPNQSLVRIMSLRDPSKKMSKSDPSSYSRIELTDTAETIRKKVRRATTDTIDGISYDRKARPGVSNLLDIASAMTGHSVRHLEAQYGNYGTGAFKDEVADAVIAKYVLNCKGVEGGMKLMGLNVMVNRICPIGERIKRFEADRDYVDKILANGAAQASELAAVTMKDVKKAMGLTLS